MFATMKHCTLLWMYEEFGEKRSLGKKGQQNIFCSKNLRYHRLNIVSFVVEFLEFQINVATVRISLIAIIPTVICHCFGKDPIDRITIYLLPVGDTDATFFIPHLISHSLKRILEGGYDQPTDQKIFFFGCTKWIASE